MTVLVVGGGKYGVKACRYFKEQKARVILVDNNPECQAREFVLKENFLTSDAKDMLELVLKIEPDFIVPAAPGHTIGKWVKEHFHLVPFPDVLQHVMKRLPQSLIVRCDEANAVLVASFMANGKICREDCLPSPEHCAVTGEPRPVPLYRLLDYAIFGLTDCGRIFAAEQLAAGIGAIRTSEILAFMQKIESKKPKTLAVGIACQCHGILSLFKDKSVM